MYQKMIRHYDVVVAGAGPSGSTAARICAEKGLSTLMIEEQAHIGYPVQCAGLLSLNAFTECEVSNLSILNKVSGAEIRAGGEVCSFNPNRHMACVVDRSVLDQEMALNAVDAGSEIQLKTIATNVSQKEHILKVRGIKGPEEIKYSVLIAADGPRSTISRGIGIPRAPMYLSGLQCDVSVEMDQDYVQIFPNASPEFFGWRIPTGPGRARVGLLGITSVLEKFASFIKPFTGCCTHFVCGTVPLGTLNSTYDDGIVIVGDAAAMAKPTSGGGVYTGARSARYAAATAFKAIEIENTGKESLAKYEHAWKDDFGQELKKGLAVLRIRQKISQHEMEKLIKVFSDPSVVEIIVSDGDMDRPSKLIRSLLKSPHMIPAGYIFTKALIRNIISY